MLTNALWANSYSPGVPLRLDYGMATLVDQFDSAVARFGERPAIDFMGRVTTYDQLKAQVDAAAAGLLDLGVTAGDRVAVLLPGCPQNVVVTQAIMRIGAIAVQHNPLYTIGELRAPFEDHEAEVVIAWDKISPMLVDLAQENGVRHIVAIDVTAELPFVKRLALRLPVKKARESRERLTGPAPEGLLSWNDLLSRGTLPADHPKPSAGDPAIMLYTSGTSGTPKGVPLTHANLAANCLQGKAWAQLRDGEETFLVVLPMFHAYGLTIGVLAGINLGACLLMLPAPEVPLIIDAVKRRTPTFAPGVPPLYARILDEAEKRDVSLEGIRIGLSGAMSLPSALVQRWEEATGGHLIEGYGLTETSPVVVGNPISDDRRAGSIGVPFPDVEIRLADPEDVTKDAPESGPGELLVKGPQVFGGYYKKPEATQEAFHDGFFRTGDVVEMGEGGYLTVVDRIKEMIVTGGFNVYPSEVEGVLREHDSIADAAVVGLPATAGGEDVVAAVVLADGHTDADAEALRRHVKGKLTAYKAPRRFVVVDELPTNPMGKVLRREVTKLLHEHTNQGD